MPSRNPYSSGAAFPDLSPVINNFVDNLVRLKTHQEDIDMRGRQLQQEKEQFEVTSAESKLKVEEAKKKQAEMQKPMDMTVHPMFLALPDESKQAALKFFTENQFTDERGVGTQESIMRGTEILEKSKPLFETVMAPVVQAKRAAVTTAWEEVQKAQETGDPKKMQIAQGKYERVRMDYENSRGKFDEHMKSLDAHERAKELLTERQTGQEAMLTDRIASAEKINQARLSAAEKVNEARLGAAEETGKLRAQTATDIAQARLDAARGIADANRNKPTSETELRAQRKELADNESKLLLNKTEEGAGPLADLHNERSDKPYAYIWNENKGTFKSATWEKIQLPKIKGKQVTAKDVYDTASQRGMTYEEVLKAIGALGPLAPVAPPPAPGELRGIGGPTTKQRFNETVNY